MADNTLPAWMQQLSGQSAGTYLPDGQGGYYGILGGGITVNPITGESSGSGANSYYHIAGDGNSPGQAYSIFNPDGTLQGNYTTSVDKSGFGTFAKNLAAVVGATYGAGLLGAGSGAGAASTAGGLDSANGVLNSAVMSGGSGAGELGAGAAGVAGGAGGTGGALDVFPAFPQVTTPAMSTFPEVSTVGDGSILGSIFGGSAPSWLKVAAPILGAIAGSKGVKSNTTQTSNINPQVAPYVYGNGGLLGGVQGLLGQQTGNGAQQVQQAGLGLLNQPVAGNGFSRFFPNR